jgi:hypothetical protein
VAVLLTQTREELRVSIGYNLGAAYEGTMTANGSTTTLVDTNLKKSDNLYNEMAVVLTSSPNDGEIRFIDDYVGRRRRYSLAGHQGQA